MTEKLKDCPFCGGKAEIKTNEDGSLKQVVCKTCGASNSLNVNAIRFWNSRVREIAPTRRCPICEYVGFWRQDDTGAFYVQCSGCGLTSAHFRHPDDVLAAWNRRPEYV